MSSIKPEWIQECARKYAERVEFTQEFTPFDSLSFKVGRSASRALLKALKELLPKEFDCCVSESYQIVVSGFRSVLQEKDESIIIAQRKEFAQIEKSDRHDYEIYGQKVTYGSGCRVEVTNRTDKIIFISSRVSLNVEEIEGLAYHSPTEKGLKLTFKNPLAAASFKRSNRYAHYGLQVSRYLTPDEMKYFRLSLKREVKQTKNRIWINCKSEVEREEAEDYFDSIIGEYQLFVSPKMLKGCSLQSGRCTNWEEDFKCFIRFDKDKKVFIIKGKERKEAAMAIRQLLTENSNNLENDSNESEEFYLSLCGHATSLCALEERIKEHIQNNKFPITCITCQHDILTEDLLHFSDKYELFKSSFLVYRSEL